MKTMHSIGALIALSIVSVSSLSHAQSALPDDTWKTFKKDGRCWAAAEPIESTGTIPGRSGPYASIQNFPEEGVSGSVVVKSGKAMTGDGGASFVVDGKSFEVLPYDGGAFVASGKPEADLIAAMRRGEKLEVHWTDPEGREATDTYSLMGFTAAKAEIDRMCR